MRKLRRVNSWVSDLTCTGCGSKVTMYHGVATSRKEALADVPTYTRDIAWSGTWNGWFIGVRGKELCPLCFLSKKS